MVSDGLRAGRGGGELEVGVGVLVVDGRRAGSGGGTRVCVVCADAPVTFGVSLLGSRNGLLGDCTLAMPRTEREIQNIKVSVVDALPYCARSKG